LRPVNGEYIFNAEKYKMLSLGDSAPKVRVHINRGAVQHTEQGGHLGAVVEGSFQPSCHHIAADGKKVAQSKASTGRRKTKLNG